MKRFLAFMLTILMILSMAVGCKKAEESPANTVNTDVTLFKPGTYTGTGKGLFGDITVEVEVDTDKILSINVKSHNESGTISDPAFDKIPKEIIEYQTVNVDAVSGCTGSSNGIIEAVTVALEQSCNDMSKITVAVQKENINVEKVNYSADVVIIGSGGAGLSAAVEALNAGRSVIVLEKMAGYGGNTARAGSALNSADPEMQEKEEMSSGELSRIYDILELQPKNDLMKGWQETLKKEIDEYKEKGVTYLFDSPSLHKLQTYIGGDYVADPELIDVLADNTLDAINFLKETGVKWEERVTIAMGATWQRSHNPSAVDGTNKGVFVNTLVDTIDKKGGQLLLEHKAEELIMADGKCVGVRGVKGNGQPFEVQATKGVIIATGGFSANVEMRQKYNKHWANLDESLATSNHTGATGDGIIMAENVGAELVGMEWIQLTPWGSLGIPTAAIDNMVFVNQEGQRFVSEDNRRDVMAGEALKQSNSHFYMIYDGHTVVDGVSVGSGKRFDEETKKLDFVYKADSLEELAQKINMPYETLKETIDDFNRAVEEGNDAFGRTVFAEKIDKSPFYATYTCPVVHHTMGGIKINTNAQVINTDGKPIENLYAAGEVTGGIHGSNRLGGNAIADIFVFGRIAGQNVSK